MIPGFRLLRRLVFTVVIIGALVVGANLYVESQVEKRVAAAVQDRFKLEDTPEVDVGGGLILLNVFSGVLPKVTIETGDVSVKSLRLRSLAIDLRDIEFDGSVLSAGDLVVTVGHGTAEAVATQAAINDLLDEQKQNATIAFNDGSVRVRARRTIGGARRTIVARGRLTLRGSTLRFVPRAVTVDGERPPAALAERAKREAAVSVKIPKLPGNLVVDEVSVGDGTLTLRAALSDQKITLAG